MSDVAVIDVSQCATTASAAEEALTAKFNLLADQCIADLKKSMKPKQKPENSAFSSHALKPDNKPAPLNPAKKIAKKPKAAMLLDGILKTPSSTIQRLQKLGIAVAVVTHLVQFAAQIKEMKEVKEAAMGLLGRGIRQLYVPAEKAGGSQLALVKDEAAKIRPEFTEKRAVPTDAQKKQLKAMGISLHFTTVTESELQKADLQMKSSLPPVSSSALYAASVLAPKPPGLDYPYTSQSDRYN